MKKEDFSLAKLLPVMFGFFIMGFIDLVGISTSYAKDEYQLSDTLANLLPMSGLFWFLILSIPTGILMNKIGRKNTVLASFVVSGLAMLIPIFAANFQMMLIAFALLGIGNTLLQVSLNPLVSNVVPTERLTSSLTAGQFIKAICSMQGPILAAWAAGLSFGWKMIFPIYAAVTVLSTIWLVFTNIKEEKVDMAQSSFGAAFSLLKDKVILLFFIGILVLVGVDVGYNTTFPKYLMERCGLPLAEAGLGNTVYFAARMIGAFLGAILLMKLPTAKFFMYSVFLAILGGVMMITVTDYTIILVGVTLFGLGYANLFGIIFSLALQRVPAKGNEVSALLIMGVSGGAILPPILGVVSDAFSSQFAAMVVIMVVWCYMALLIPIINKECK